MSARELLDEVRSDFVDADTSTTREIVYTRFSDDVSYPPLNSFVGGGQFNKEEKETIEDWQSFGGLKLIIKPIVDDRVEYDGETYEVTRWLKLGQLWTVFGQRKRHNGRPTK